MSRRGRDYPAADYYEERERDFYARGPRRTTREYDDIDVELSRARSHPDFLREDYERTSVGPLVVRERREERQVDVDDTRSVRSTATTRRPPRREVEREEVVIKEDERRPRERPREREREVEREELVIRRGEGARTPRPGGEERETEIEIRRDEREPVPRPRMREREIERDEIDVRSVRSERPPPPRPILREREVDREEFIIRRGDGDRRPPRREVEKEEITIRTNDAERPRPPRREVEKEEVLIRQTTRDDDTRSVRSSRPREVSEEREKITIRARSRGRDRSQPPPRARDDLVARETEEFVIRRRRPPSPSPSPSPPRREVEREQIIIRERKERSPSPAPLLPPPPPEPEPVRLPTIFRPPIHQEIRQEIITHHRHIDHGTKHFRSQSVRHTHNRLGVERARSPSPDLPLAPLPPPPEEKIESTEIEIRRRYGPKKSKSVRFKKRANTISSGGGRNEEEEIKIERKSRDLDHLSTRSERGEDDVISRSRSMDAPRRRYYEDDLEAEADYYNRRALERGYPGEAYNGSTRDWAIVDVPPGTERVRLDGAGGGSQEITWQRYNGVRRSKFLTSDREFDTPYGLPAPPEPVEDRRVMAPPRGGGELVRREKKSDMWTEITKDLVSKDAIEYMGYQYEETEYFFYVMEYLRYVSLPLSLFTADFVC